MDLITGATGFIGSRLAAALHARGRALRLTARHAPPPGSPIVVADLADRQALTEACRGVDRVFHCAGHAHAFKALAEDEALAHRRINFEGTHNLLEAAMEAGVRSFVFLSSVKAMAEPGDDCVDEDWPGEPATAYGKAKRAAEDAVLAAGRQSGMHVVNLRLSMVYGAGGRGNLERMARLVSRGWFPPLPETGNRRSLIHVDDVVDVMDRVADDARAAGRTFILAGNETPSGRALYDAIRAALELPPRHWAIPAWSLRAAARLGDAFAAATGRRSPLDSESLDRLLGSACYSPAHIQQTLGWRARISLADGLSEMLCGNTHAESGRIRPLHS